MQDCIFCKIIRQEIPSEVVYEDDDILAFKDIYPAAPVHILIIPKKHIASVNEITEEDVKIIGNIFLVIKRLATDLGVAESGYRVVTNIGRDGGQEVGHLHYHLLAGKPLGKKIG